MNDDILGSLKGLLGENADEKINSVLKALGNNQNKEKKEESISDDIIINNDNNEISNVFSENTPNMSNDAIGNLMTPEGFEYMAKIKGIIDEMGHSNDPRSNLLMSLKPYMRTNRQKSIDNAVKILNLTRFSGLFKL